MNIKLMYTIILSSVFSSCSQNYKKDKDINQTKSSNNIMLSEIKNKIESFNERPYYSVNFDNSNSGCQFEILVNDVPVMKKIGTKGAMISSVPINSCILESGKQKVKIKLYPNIGKDKLISTNKNSPLSLSISFRKDAWDNQNLNEINVFELPPIIVPEIGLDYFEKEYEFDAEVPYKFDGWKMSKDLTKIPNIEDKVLNKYKEIYNLLEKKDYLSFEKLKKNKDKEMNISFFLKPQEIVEGSNFDKAAFIEKDALIQPLVNVRVVFYGYNKLVTLENIKDKGSALRTIINHPTKDGKLKQETIKFPILFHMPQNSNELEIIR